MTIIKKIGMVVASIVLALACMVIFLESFPPYNGETDESIAEGKIYLNVAVIIAIVSATIIWLLAGKKQIYKLFD